MEERNQLSASLDQTNTKYRARSTRIGVANVVSGKNLDWASLRARISYIKKVRTLFLEHVRTGRFL